MLGRFEMSTSCLRVAISPSAKGSSALAKRSYFARASSSTLAIELIKFRLRCAILDSMSSDPRRVLRKQEGQRVGRP